MAYCKVTEMRRLISEVYPNASWAYKVDRMPDYQVMAIYFKFLNDGKFDKTCKKESRSSKAGGFTFEDSKEYGVEQLTFDI